MYEHHSFDRPRATAGQPFVPLRPGVKALYSPKLTFGEDALDLRVNRPLGASSSSPLKNGNILLPTGTPVFYLHGTFSAGESLLPLTSFIANIQNDHPGYISYIPEVRNGTGIETVSNAKETLPAYKLAIRDMGDFHYQVAHNNIQALKQILEADLHPLDRDKRLGEFFNILPAERAHLLPVVKEYLAYRLFERPPEFKVGYPLADIVAQQVAKVHKEFGKLEVSGEEQQRAIIDTHFLRLKAQLQGKELNLSMDTFSDSPEVINLRSITCKDIAVMQGYLMFLEKKLGRAVEAQLHQAYQTALDSGEVSKEELAKRAKRTAVKLVGRIAPQGMAFGHSQGGTVLISALLNYLAKSPKEPDAALNPETPGSEVLGGRYIGIEALFSSPLSGIPDEPAWGKSLTESLEKWLRFPGQPTTVTRWMMKKLLWRFFDNGRPAIHEMKAGSPMINKFQTLLPMVGDEELTVVAAHDVHDTFVEPAAALLHDVNGKTPGNVFNIPLEAPVQPVRYEDGLSIIEAEIRNHGLSPDAFLVKALRWMPGRVKEAIFEAYLGIVSGLGQHSALVNHPEYVRQALGQKMIQDPQMQTRVLNTRNFEPFRYQALIARGRSFQKNILDLPLPQAIKALNDFESKYPTFLSMLIANAQEWVPFTNSAAFAATRILDKTIDLLEKALSDPVLRPKYQYSIQRALRQIEHAHLKPLTQGGVSPSRRARIVLRDIYARENPGLRYA